MLLELNDVPLDRESIEQSKLDIQDKKRRNLLTWSGQFSPQLVHALLDCHASDGDMVLDPFAGSGTTLVECGRLGLRAFGTEINPAACHMAQIYSLINTAPDDRENLITETRDVLDEVLPQPFFSRHKHLDEDQVRGSLVECWKEQTAIRKKLLETLIVQLDFYKPGLTVEKVFSAWGKLADVVRELPFSTLPVELANADARNIPLEDGTVDMVLTSPPYINVFNYHQQFRRSVEALGWDLLDVARSEIGSNRKNRGNRFLTVIQFCLDMADVLHEMKRVVKRSGRMIFVVGRESNVRKTSFLNGDIVAKLAVGCCGLSLTGRQERVYKNKFGNHIYEDILNLTPNRIAAICTPDDVARTALEGAKLYAPEGSLADLEEALSAIGSVAKSPLYNRANDYVDHVTDAAPRKTQRYTAKHKASGGG